MAVVANEPRRSMVGIVEGLHVMKFDYFMQDEALAKDHGERIQTVRPKNPKTNTGCSA